MKKVFFPAILMLCTLVATSQNLIRINSIYDDQNPVISPDGSTLYITIANHPQNSAGKKDPGDIWMSSWQNDQWSVPVPATASWNDRNYNTVAGFSADGKAAYLFNHYESGGQPATSQGISVSRQTQSGWSFPEKISIPYFLNRSPAVSGQITSDGKVLVYSAEAYNTKGAEDIYVTLKGSDGKWEEPKNLGPVINTAFQEISPALSADKKYLYFSSNGRRGYGSFDIYYAERLDDTWLNWSMPINMGSQINTDGRELFYRTFPLRKIAMFTSTQNSDGYGDIKVKVDSTHSALPDSLVKLVEIRRDAPLSAADKIINIHGRVTDSKTGRAVIAQLEFKSDSTRVVGGAADGSYEVGIPSTKVYTILVNAPGYVGMLEKLDIHTFEMKQLELNFKLQAIEIGTIVNLKSVLFEMGKTTMLAASYDELNVVVDLLKLNPKIEIELAGHTDARGDAKMNVKLSQGRVDIVKSYLVAKGISARRITGKGYGGKKPIASSTSEENRRLNRRVEFTIIKD